METDLLYICPKMFSWLPVEFVDTCSFHSESRQGRSPPETHTKTQLVIFGSVSHKLVMHPSVIYSQQHVDSRTLTMDFHHPFLKQELLNWPGCLDTHKSSHNRLIPSKQGIPSVHYTSNISAFQLQRVVVSISKTVCSLSSDTTV